MAAARDLDPAMHQRLPTEFLRRSELQSFLRGIQTPGKSSETLVAESCRRFFLSLWSTENRAGHQPRSFVM